MRTENIPGRVRLVPPLEHDRRAFVRGSARVLLAVVVLPNATFWLLGLFTVVPRPPVNLDYVVAALVMPWLGATGTGVLTGLLALLDAAVAGAYRYCGTPSCLITALPDVALLPVSFIAPIALSLLGGAAVLGAVVRRLLLDVPYRLGPNLVAAAAGTALSLVLAPLAPAPHAESRAVALGDFLDNAVIPAIAWHTEFRGVAMRPVAAATSPLFEALGEGAPLPERVVLVVLESWGRFREPVLNERALAPLDREALRPAYRIETGVVPHYGGTVKGELRELCQAESASVRPDLDLFPVHECLPLLFRGRGYTAIAAHGFRSDFFNREEWWPRLGFDSIYFRSEMAAALATERTCGQEWEGICDTEAAALLDRWLNSTDQPSTGPLFLYWLSLNTHGPFTRPPPPGVRLESCGGSSDSGDVPVEICSFLGWHSAALGAVSRLALEHAGTGTAWIIVGDHPPRFGAPRVQALLDPEAVPWVRLWPREWQRPVQSATGLQDAMAER